MLNVSICCILVCTVPLLYIINNWCIVTSIITSSVITAITMTGMFLYRQRSIKTKVKSTTLETVSPVIYDELNITHDSDFPVSDNPAYGPEYI